jgi:hypothetical protein
MTDPALITVGTAEWRSKKRRLGSLMGPVFILTGRELM